MSPRKPDKPRTLRLVRGTIRPGARVKARTASEANRFAAGVIGKYRFAREPYLGRLSFVFRLPRETVRQAMDSARSGSAVMNAHYWTRLQLVLQAMQASPPAKANAAESGIVWKERIVYAPAPETGRSADAPFVEGSREDAGKTVGRAIPDVEETNPQAGKAASEVRPGGGGGSAADATAEATADAGGTEAERSRTGDGKRKTKQDEDALASESPDEGGRKRKDASKRSGQEDVPDRDAPGGADGDHVPSAAGRGVPGMMRLKPLPGAIARSDRADAGRPDGSATEGAAGRRKAQQDALIYAVSPAWRLAMRHHAFALGIFDGNAQPLERSKRQAPPMDERGGRGRGPDVVRGIARRVMMDGEDDGGRSAETLRGIVRRGGVSLSAAGVPQRPAAGPVRLSYRRSVPASFGDDDAAQAFSGAGSAARAERSAPTAAGRIGPRVHDGAQVQDAGRQRAGQAGIGRGWPLFGDFVREELGSAAGPEPGAVGARRMPLMLRAAADGMLRRQPVIGATNRAGVAVRPGGRGPADGAMRAVFGSEWLPETAAWGWLPEAAVRRIGLRLPSWQALTADAWAAFTEGAGRSGPSVAPEGRRPYTASGALAAARPRMQPGLGGFPAVGGWPSRREGAQGADTSLTVHLKHTGWGEEAGSALGSYSAPGSFAAPESFSATGPLAATGNELRRQADGADSLAASGDSAGDRSGLAASAGRNAGEDAAIAGLPESERADREKSGTPWLEEQGPDAADVRTSPPAVRWSLERETESFVSRFARRRMLDLASFAPGAAEQMFDFTGGAADGRRGLERVLRNSRSVAGLWRALLVEEGADPILRATVIGDGADDAGADGSSSRSGTRTRTPRTGASAGQPGGNLSTGWPLRVASAGGWPGPGGQFVPPTGAILRRAASGTVEARRFAYGRGGALGGPVRMLFRSAPMLPLSIGGSIARFPGASPVPIVPTADEAAAVRRRSATGGSLPGPAGALVRAAAETMLTIRRNRADWPDEARGDSAASGAARGLPGRAMSALPHRSIFGAAGEAGRSGSGASRFAVVSAGARPPLAGARTTTPRASTVQAKPALPPVPGALQSVSGGQPAANGADAFGARARIGLPIREAGAPSGRALAFARRGAAGSGRDSAGSGIEPASGTPIAASSGWSSPASADGISTGQQPGTMVPQTGGGRPSRPADTVLRRYADSRPTSRIAGDMTDPAGSRLRLDVRRRAEPPTAQLARPAATVPPFRPIAAPPPDEERDLSGGRPDAYGGTAPIRFARAGGRGAEDASASGFSGEERPSLAAAATPMQRQLVPGQAPGQAGAAFGAAAAAGAMRASVVHFARRAVDPASDPVRRRPAASASEPPQPAPLPSFIALRAAQMPIHRTGMTTVAVQAARAAHAQAGAASAAFGFAVRPPAAAAHRAAGAALAPGASAALARGASALPPRLAPSRGTAAAPAAATAVAGAPGSRLARTAPAPAHTLARTAHAAASAAMRRLAPLGAALPLTAAAGSGARAEGAAAAAPMALAAPFSRPAEPDREAMLARTIVTLEHKLREASAGLESAEPEPPDLDHRRPPHPAAAPVPVEPPPQPPAVDMAQLQELVGKLPQLDIRKIADRVYREIERKLRFERQTRGF